MSTSEEKYARSVAKTVATQLLAAQGLDSAQLSTLDILSDLLIRYISEVGSQTHLYAEASHRTVCNPLDVTLALRNMGHDVPALLSYAQKLEDTPFAQNISQFPLAKSLPPPTSFASFNEAPPPHIPAFLPAFPDPHTLLETANFVPTTHDPATRQEELVEQQKLGEAALVRLTAREQPESDALRTAAAATEAVATEDAAEAAINPFLVSAMWDAPEAEAGRSLASRPGPSGQGPSEVAPIDVEWVVGGREQAQAPSGLAFEGFTLTKGVGSRVALGTSGRRAPDAYGENGGVAEEAMGRRKKLITMSEANKNKVREMLTTRAEDGEMAYGVELPDGELI